MVNQNKQYFLLYFSIYILNKIFSINRKKYIYLD